MDVYDLEKIYRKVFVRKMRKETGFFFSDEGVLEQVTTIVKKKDYSTSQQFTLDYNIGIEENIQRLRSIFQSLEITWREFQEYYCHQALFRWYYFTADGDHYHMGKLPSSAISALVSFIQFIHTNILVDDYAEAHKFIESNALDGQSKIKFTYGNITVKTYLNCKVEIEGLTDKQKAKIDRMLQLKVTLR